MTSELTQNTLGRSPSYCDYSGASVIYWPLENLRGREEKKKRSFQNRLVTLKRGRSAGQPDLVICDCRSVKVTFAGNFSHSGQLWAEGADRDCCGERGKRCAQTSWPGKQIGTVLVVQLSSYTIKLQRPPQGQLVGRS
jgi:hypothetical protein